MRYGISIRRCASFIAGALAALQFSALAVTARTPGADDAVLEVLPAITLVRPAHRLAPGPSANPMAAALQARQDIRVARQTGDTRYWGRAQAVLAPWWDQPTAPADIAVLQATVQQGRHEFAASRKVLEALLAREPAVAQAWLNLAALERLSGRYAASMDACEAVARAGQPLYAQSCRLETQSLQGRHAAAAQGFQTLLKQGDDDDQRGWLLSLLAESEERGGRDAAAAQAYERSLALAPDLYTSIAYSDLLLRTGRPDRALAALAKLPGTDAVLLRRATAMRRLGDARWTALRATLRERANELTRRGDDPTLHAREAALAALWLDGDMATALALARRNLQLQREPIDWWVAMHSARQSGDAAALAEFAEAIRATGLVDLRLSRGGQVAAR